MMWVLLGLLQDPVEAARRTAAALQKPELAAAARQACAGDSVLFLVYRAALARARDKGWKSDDPEVKAFAAYAGRLDADHARAIEGLLQEKPGLEFPTLLALAHFDLLEDEKKAQELAPKLKLIKKEDRWMSREGELTSELRAGAAPADPKFEAATQFGIRYLQACSMVRQAIKNKDLWEDLHKLLLSIKPGSPKHLGALADRVKPLIVCRKCDGAGGKSCEACQGSGERTATCGNCNGGGKLLKGYSGRTGQPIIEDCKQCKTQGKWQVDCPQCDKGEVKCQGPCKGTPWKQPAMEEIASEDPCAACKGTGFPFRRVVHPCPFCRGLGGFFKPKGAEGKLLGSPDQ
jgi:hypothetical protein